MKMERQLKYTYYSKTKMEWCQALWYFSQAFKQANYFCFQVHLQNSNFKNIACSCSHLSQFGGNLLVRPNTLNVAHSLEQLLHPWDNPVGIATVGGVWLLYFLLMLWARRRDNIDAIMVCECFIFYIYNWMILDNEWVIEYHRGTKVFTNQLSLP